LTPEHHLGEKNVLRQKAVAQHKIMKILLTDQIDEKTLTERKTRKDLIEREEAINESNRGYKEIQNTRRKELRAAEKQEKADDIARHVEQRLV